MISTASKQIFIKNSIFKFMKYFDKSFFKFTLGFLCIVSLSLAIIFFTTNLAEGGDRQPAQSGRAD